MPLIVPPAAPRTDTAGSRAALDQLCHHQTPPEVTRTEQKIFIICMKQQRGRVVHRPTAALTSTNNVSTQETHGPSFRTQPKQNSSATVLGATLEPGRPCAVVAQDRQTAHTKPTLPPPSHIINPPPPHARLHFYSSRVDDDCTPAEHTSKIRWNTRHPPYRAWSTQAGQTRQRAH